jgi:hypothetical protein
LPALTAFDGSRLDGRMKTLLVDACADVDNLSRAQVARVEYSGRRRAPLPRIWNYWTVPCGIPR